MFIRLLFKKLNIKENKYIMAVTYGLIYSIVFFIVLTLAQVFLNNLDVQRNLIYSVVIGVLMFGVYLIKWNFIKA